MKTSFRAFCATTMVCLFFSAAKAQTDTSYYDLGRIHLKKSSAQAIIIKGTDLEKMPFSNLGEALNVWFDGTLFNRANYVYVIDGTVINDINALSVYDIEEVALIQSALANISGANAQQILVVIKTRRNYAKKSGLTATLQTSLIRQRVPADQEASNKSTTAVYQQYNLSWFKNTEHIQSGISAGFLNDVLPGVKSSTFDLTKSPTLSRFRFNAYLDAKLGTKSVLSVTAGFVPQQYSQSSTNSYFGSPTTSISSSATTKDQGRLFQSSVKLKSTLAAGLINTLAAGYQNVKETDNINVTSLQNPGSTGYNSTLNNITKTQNYLVNDNLSYLTKAGAWDFEPSINLAFRHFINNLNITNSNTQTYPGVSNQYLQNSIYSAGYHTFLLTPNLSIRYQNAFELQAGIQALLNDNSPQGATYKPQRVYPFAAISLNILQLAKSDTDLGLSINGSFSSVNPVIQTDVSSQLMDFPQSVSGTPIYVYNLALTPSSTVFNPYEALSQFQLGSKFSILKNKFALTYNFSSSQYYGTAINSISASGTYYSAYFYTRTTTTIHRIALNSKIAAGANFSWSGNLSTSFGKTDSRFDQPTQNILAFSDHVITGGFANRFTGKQWFAGIDVLYRLKGQQLIDPYTNAPSGNSRAFSLQNLYAGTHVKPNIEVYLSTRNMIENNKSTITDKRQFYGVGVKAGF